MYIYNELDKQLVSERVQQFRGQTQRFLSGELSEEAFLPLRLQNGLYVQRHAPMLRVAVPYGMLNSAQLRMLAQVSRDYDKGYCHITTRQNIQFNWPPLDAIPDLLEDLAVAEMHSIQTSGNCIRNVTSDPFAGVAPDEVVDPRPYCELVRQWSTLHPEFAFLPRKFKIAISGSEQDRASIQFHDIGLQLVERDGSLSDVKENSERGFKVFVGGGLGRTPIVASELRDFLPECDLLSYLCAIVRVYNQTGRRDNKYKARIKILVRAMGIEAFAEKVEAEWQRIKGRYPVLEADEIARAQAFFSAPAYEVFDDETVAQQLQIQTADLLPPSQRVFKQWLARNTRAHKVAGYRSVTLSLKPTGVPAGDLTDAQLLAVADLADRYSFGEVRTTQQQNIVLGDVASGDLLELWLAATQQGFTTANIATLTDITCCPGGDFCALANAKSIPVADAIQRRFDDMDYVYDLGDLSLKISGCMNACAHHNISHIGILGVDKKGQEFYQVMLGGSAGDVSKAAVGKVVGPAFSAADIPAALETILELYVAERSEGERFVDLVNRIGMARFKRVLYPETKSPETKSPEKKSPETKSPEKKSPEKKNQEAKSSDNPSEPKLKAVSV